MPFAVKEINYFAQLYTFHVYTFHVHTFKHLHVYLVSTFRLHVYRVSFSTITTIERFYVYTFHLYTFLLTRTLPSGRGKLPLYVRRAHGSAHIDTPSPTLRHTVGL